MYLKLFIEDGSRHSVEKLDRVSAAFVCGVSCRHCPVEKIWLQENAANIEIHTHLQVQTIEI
jgi:hypothetical protein